MPETVQDLLGAWRSGTGPLYRTLAGRLRTLIRSGLLPGTDVPSERQLAAALSVSRTTVVRAYGLLKSDGWLESRAGSGTTIRLRDQAAVLPAAVPPGSDCGFGAAASGLLADVARGPVFSRI